MTSLLRVESRVGRARKIKLGYFYPCLGSRRESLSLGLSAPYLDLSGTGIALESLDQEAQPRHPSISETFWMIGVSQS